MIRVLISTFSSVFIPHALLKNWKVLWPILLLPVVFALPALPIDETRYLAVAWEMHHSGNYLVPHLNGAAYSDKPPLLFWLINLSWWITGIHAWSARLVGFACSLLSLLLLERLVLRLGGSAQSALRAAWLLLGMVYFAVFSSAIMFDVLLTTCVLLALHGMLDLDQNNYRRGMGVLALGIGLGILAKGPVMLLDIGFIILLGPWWSAGAAARKWHWYGCALGAVGGGALLGLAWAIPAAWVGGESYAHAIFLHQTVDRMSQSFAHRRPFWWYLVILPLMILPWPLVMRTSIAAWRTTLEKRATRFALVWIVPTFLMFSLVSGKQPHYLLPMLPSVALLLALLAENPTTRWRGGMLGLLVMLFGGLLLALPFLTALSEAVPGLTQAFQALGISANLLETARGLWPLWGVLVIAIGLGFIIKRKFFVEPHGFAMACAASVLLGELAVAQTLQTRLDLSPAAAQIAAAQRRGQPIVHVGWHHGVYEFAGRLTQPLEKIDYAHLQDWCMAHPNGLVITYYGKYPIAAPPIFQQPFRIAHVAIWRAADLVTTSNKPLPLQEDGSDDSEE